jgi:hypothetical protein
MDFPGGKFDIDCDFELDGTDYQGDSWNKKHMIYALYAMCTSARNTLELLKMKHTHYRNEIERIVKEDLYAAVPEMEILERRKRWIAARLALAVSLVTLATESISSHLQRKRNQAMAKAMDALRKSQQGMSNRLNTYGEELLLYGQFDLNSTDTILKTLQSIYDTEAPVANRVRKLNSSWPTTYLTHD